MEFYCGAYSDFVVPDDQDLLDSIPSPDSWSNWGMNSSDNVSSLDKVFTLEAKTTKGDYNFDHRSLGHDTGLEKSFQNKPQPGGYGTVRGSPEPSFNQRAVPYDQTNYQLQDLGAFEATDDYFLDSILEYPHTDDVDDGKHFSKSFGCQFGKTHGDNSLADITRHSSSTASGAYNLRVSEYAKRLPFSSPEEGEPVEGLAPLGQESRNLHSCEDFSLEEYILQELEMVISQFTEKTRKCFRDALYRLAQNSIQQHSECNQDDEYCIPVEGQTSRIDPMSSIRHEEGRATKEKELETNSIDRAIATLMFDKMDFNLHDVSAATSANSEKQIARTETVPVPRSPFSSSQIQKLQHLSNSSEGDAEVPRCHMDQQTGKDRNQNDVGRDFFMLNFASVT